jgi:hypothetical protein
MAGPSPFIVKQVRKKGRRYHIKPSDLLDLIEHESGFQPGAVSSANAQGLTQFIPGTARQYGVQYGTSKKAQKSQIKGAAKYLTDLGWGPSDAAKRKALAGYYGAASPYADALISSEKYAQYDKGLSKGAIPQPRKKSETQKKRVLKKPAQSFAPERAAAALAFIRDEDKDPMDYATFAATQKSLADTPAKYKTKTVEAKKAKEQVGGEISGVAKGPTLHGSPKKEIVQIGKLAEKMGLSVGENPHYGGVTAVHATGSYHYSGRAIDVSSASATLMRKFAKRVAKLYGPKLAELFWNGPGATNIDNGNRVQKFFVSGHTDHVHVAI